MGGRQHTITFTGGDTDDCWCSHGKDHTETETNAWDPFAEDDDDDMEF